MASKRQELATDDDPWKVSAFISALMELLLSVLLLLGAAIAFITSQLVKYFDLDPPCTYIGCSHTRSLRKQRRCSHHHHSKSDHLSELFPNRRKSRVFSKLQLRSDESFSSNGNTDGPLLGEKIDSSSRQSIAPSSDEDIGHDHEDCNVSYDHQSVNGAYSDNSNLVHRKPSVPKYVKPKASFFYGDSNLSSKEECIPLFSSKAVSACSRNFGAAEDCEASLVFSEKPSFPREKLERETVTDGDSSAYSDNKDECYYLLLEDEDLIQRKYVKPKAAIFGSDGTQSAEEELVPLYSTRSVSACGNDCNAKDNCQMSSAATDDLKKASSEKEKVQRGTIPDMDASISSEIEHEHCYMLLEDEDPSLQKYVKPSAVGDVMQSTKEECIPLFIRRSISAHSSDSDAEHDCEMSSSDTDDFKKPDSQKQKLGGGTFVEGNTSISAKEECIPLFFRRSISAHGSDSDLEDDCERTSTHANNLKKTSLQKENLVGTFVGDNASVSSDAEHEHHYMRLKDDEVFASISSDTEHEHHYMQLKDDDGEGFEAPFFDVQGLSRDFEDEHHDMLFEGEDEEAESKPPLPECISDRGLETPKAMTTADLGNKVAKAVLVSDSQGSSEIEQAVKNFAQYEWIKDSMDSTCANACHLSSVPGEGENMGPLFIPLNGPAIEENKVEDEGFDMWNKGQINSGFSADEAKMEFVQAFEIVEAGDSEGNMVEEQVRADCTLKEELLKEPLEGLSNGHVLEKMDTDSKSCLAHMEVLNGLLDIDKVLEIRDFESSSESVLEDQLCQVQGHVEESEMVPVRSFNAVSGAHGDDASKVAIESDMQGIHGNIFSSRGIEERCSPLDSCVHETDGKSDEKTIAKSSLEVGIQEEMDQYLSSFKGGLPEKRVAKCVSLLDDIDVQQGNIMQTEVAKGNSLDDAASQRDEQSSKSEQGELALKDSGEDNAEIPSEEDQEEGLDALKEALRAERKILAELEMELENERNAAAIATSEAMAMISRLQEEKSAMQMEVVQLQRMSEEKAEYDEQAMELLKEILLKREKEKHALEKEVELYRERLRAENVDMSNTTSVEKANENVVMPSLTPVLLLRGINEDNDSVSPEGKNERLKELPSLEAFYDASSPHATSTGQNMACRECFGISPQQLVELKDSKGSRFDQVGTCIQEDKGNCAETFTKGLNGLHDIHQEVRGTSRSIFSTNDEETQFILERLWVLEEELRELRREDGPEVPLEAHPMKRNSDSSGVYQEHKEADEAGMLLPIHDVYEVESTPHKGIQQSDPLEFSKNTPKDLESFSNNISQEHIAASKNSARPYNISVARALFPSKETHCDRTLALKQDYLCVDGSHQQCLKAADGNLITTDIIQQLVARLQLLETDRGLLREILDSFRHRDVERKLLQEIAQYLRELPMAGSGGASTGGVLQGPVLPTFNEICGSVLKKRRYCSGPGQTQASLLQQKSI